MPPTASRRCRFLNGAATNYASTAKVDRSVRPIWPCRCAIRFGTRPPASSMNGFATCVRCAGPNLPPKLPHSAQTMAQRWLHHDHPDQRRRTSALSARPGEPSVQRCLQAAHRHGTYQQPGRRTGHRATQIAQRAGGRPPEHADLHPINLRALQRIRQRKANGLRPAENT